MLGNRPGQAYQSSWISRRDKRDVRPQSKTGRYEIAVIVLDDLAGLVRNRLYSANQPGNVLVSHARRAAVGNTRRRESLDGPAHNANAAVIHKFGMIQQGAIEPLTRECRFD